MINEKNYNAWVYVGTYAKYNSGNLNGAWVDLENFDNEEDFLDHCYEIHDDEEDPELMFQDYENFPKEFYSESEISVYLWDWLELNVYQKEIIDAFIKCFNPSYKEALNKYEGAYMGQYNSFKDFAEQLFDETNEVPEHLANYIDYDYVASEYKHDYIMHDGHIFSRNW